MTYKELTILAIGDGGLAFSCLELLNSAMSAQILLLTNNESTQQRSRQAGFTVQSLCRENLKQLDGQKFDYVFNIGSNQFYQLGMDFSDVSNLVKISAINYHDSCLPRYAGFFSTSWAILNGERSHGVTWHIWEPLIDSGPVLEASPFEILPDDTAASLNVKCFEAGLDLFPKIIERCREQRWEGQTQDLRKRTYYDLWKRPAHHGIRELSDGFFDEDRIRRATQFDFADNNFISYASAEALHPSVKAELKSLTSEQKQSCATLLSEVVKYESTWVNKLALPEGYISKGISDSGRETFVVSGKFNLSEVAAMASAALFRIWGIEKTSIALSPGILVERSRQSANLISSFIPVECEVCEYDTFQSLTEKFDSVLRKPESFLGFRSDIFSRYTSLEHHRRWYQVVVSEERRSDADQSLVYFQIDSESVEISVSHSIVSCRREALGFLFLGLENKENRQFPVSDWGTRISPGQGRKIYWGERKPVPTDDSILMRIAHIAENFQDFVAIRDSECEISYRAFWKKIEKYVVGLKQRQIGPGSRVIVDMERNVELPMLFLAILRVGASFVPINSTDPFERKRHLIKMSGARLCVLKDTHYSSEVICPQCTLQELAEYSLADSACVQVKPEGSSEAYLLFTSGSTGNPKGVRISHVALINHMLWMIEEFNFTQDDLFLLKTPHTFDASIWELIAPFMLGGTLNIASPSSHLFGETLAAEVISFRPTRLQLVPTQLRLILEGADADTFASVKTLFLGGEALTRSVVVDIESIFRGEIVNLYGPTETTIDILYARGLTSAQQVIPVGTPINNCGVAIVDNHGQVLAPGFKGEIVLFGLAIAQGYLGADSSEEERFDHSDNKFPSFRTGDYGWCDHNGTVYYEGRTGSELKHRGYRIDRTEIESALLAVPGVLSGVCYVWPTSESQGCLCGYISVDPGANLTGAMVLRSVSEKLPHYMIPDHIIFLETLPTLKSGKIDFNKLPHPTPNNFRLPPDESSGLSIHEKLLNIWKGILSVEDIQPDDTFFGLGGNSLKLVQLRSLIENTFRRKESLLTWYNLVRYKDQVAFLESGPGEGIDQQKNTPLPVSSQQDYHLDEPIAVIGIDTIFPGSRNHQEYFDALLEKRDSVRSISPMGDEADNDLRFFCLESDAIHEFDHTFFGVSLADTLAQDPQHFIFLQNVWRALEDAGVSPTDDTLEIGLFGGCSSNTTGRPVLGKHMSHEWLTIQSGWDKDHVATKTAFHLGFTGPAVTIQTACSTSLSAVHYACQSLRSFDCNVAVAASVAFCSERDEPYHFEQSGILSDNGHCRPFSAEASGTLFGNGAAAVVLKRLSDALKDNDTIYALIRSSALNNDGASKQSYSAPSVAGQRAVIEKALKRARVDLDEVRYIECHGSGTSLGDAVEVAAIREVFGSQHKMYLGSVKGNIGHMDAVAGMAGLVKMALSLEKGIIPATLTGPEVMPLLMEADSQLVVNRENVKWHSGSRRIGGVSSFGVGGTNAHCILEGPPPKINVSLREDSRGFLFVFSAHDDRTYRKVIEDFRDWLLLCSDVSLRDISYSLCCRRQHHRVRGFIVSHSRTDLLKQLSISQCAITKDENSTRSLGSFSNCNLNNQKVKDIQGLGYAWQTRETVDFLELYKGVPVTAVRLPRYPLQPVKPWSVKKIDKDRRDNTVKKIPFDDGNAWEPCLTEITDSEIKNHSSLNKSGKSLLVYEAKVDKADLQILRGVFCNHHELILEEFPAVNYSGSRINSVTIVIRVDPHFENDWSKYSQRVISLASKVRSIVQELDETLETLNFVALIGSTGNDRSQYKSFDGYVRALARTIRAEYRGIRVGYLCCEGEPGRESLNRYSSKIPSLIDSHSELYAQGSKLYGLEFKRISPKSVFVQADNFKPVLISGAFGSVGPKLIGELIERGFRSFILTFRSSGNKESRSWVDSSRSFSEIDAFSQMPGISIKLVECDLEDFTQVKHLIDKTAEESPQGLFGIIHLCRKHYDSLFESADIEQTVNSCKPAIEGACNILKAVSASGISVGSVTLFSSTISYTPLPGQFSYVLTNCVLDDLAESQWPGIKINSINWGLWEDSVSAEAPESLKSGLLDLGFQGCGTVQAVEHLYHVMCGSPQRSLFAPVVKSQIGPFKFSFASSDNASLRTEGTEKSMGTEQQLEQILNDILQPQNMPTSPDALLSKCGLSSLTAIELKGKIKRTFGVNIPLANIFKGISKNQLREYLSLAPLQDNSSDYSFLSSECSVEGEQLFLTERQKGVLFESKLFPEDSSYTEIFAWEITENNDKTDVAMVVSDLCRCHSLLGAVYNGEEGSIYVRKGIVPELSFLGKYSSDVEALDALRLRPLKLQSSGDTPLCIFYYWKVYGEDSIRLALVVHHLIIDLDSIRLLLRDLCDEPRSKTAVNEINSFADFENEFLKGSEAQSLRKGWQKYLTGFEKKTTLRYSKRMVTTRSAALSLKKEFSNESKESLLHVCQTISLSPFLVFLTGKFLMIYTLSGERDLVINVPVRAATEEEVQNRIGFRVNTIPVRVRIRESQSVESLLIEIRDSFASAVEGAQIPFGQIVAQCSGIKAELENPFSDFSIGWQGAPLDYEGSKRTAKSLGSIQDSAKFPINVMLYQEEASFHSIWQYDRDYYSEASIDYLVSFYDQVVQTLAQKLPCSVANVKNSLAKAFPSVCHGPPLSTENNILPLYHFLSSKFEYYSLKIAVTAADGTLTYADLARRVDEIAGRLRLLLAENDLDPVAVYLGRSVNLVPTILALIKCGIAYVPLDQLLPLERRMEIARVAGVKNVITLCEYVSHNPDLNEIAIDFDESFNGDETRDYKYDPQRPAYIMFTSGTSGTPKGIAISGQNLLTFLESARSYLQCSDQINVCATTSVTFDISLLELLYPLTVGGTITICPSAISVNPFLLISFIEKYECNFIQMTPTAWKLLQDAEWRGKSDLTAISGGERISPDLFKWIQACTKRIFNFYGPTEATVYATASTHYSEVDGMTVGRPLPGYSVFVLDEHGEIESRGRSGELVLKGSGIGLGYINASKEDQSRFFSTEDGIRCYRTGDRARILLNGDIDVLGRMDNQVKLHGYRVELEEIERVIETIIPGAQVVVELVDDPERVRLRAYIQLSSDSEKPANLSDQLKLKLPEYMIPAEFLWIDTFPQNSSGKIDRKALRHVSPSGTRSVPGVTLGKDYGALLSHIKAVSEQVDFDEERPFMDLGFTSLRLAELQQSLSQISNREVNLIDFYRYGTPKAFLEMFVRSAPVKTQQQLSRGAKRRAYFQRLLTLEEQEQQNVT